MDIQTDRLNLEGDTRQLKDATYICTERLRDKEGGTPKSGIHTYGKTHRKGGGDTKTNIHTYGKTNS